jgi:type I restriction enzyme, S subunit
MARQNGKTAQKNGNGNGGKSLETWIWDAACSIRGAQEAAKYKDFILPLIFTKRLCDVFDDELDRIAQEVGSRAKAFTLVAMDHKLVRFYLPLQPENPDDPVWSVIRQLSSKIGVTLTGYLRDIAKENPLLDGIINRVDFNATTHGQRDLNDILFVMVGATRGKLTQIKSNVLPAFMNQNMWRIISRNKSLNQTFLFFFLRLKIKKILSKEDEQARGFFKKSDFKVIQIPIPPIEEQRKIAEVLSLVQEAIRQQEQLITTTTELKTATMQKLFTEGTRGEPQKMTEIGLIPESWDVVKLADVAQLFQYGTSVKCDYDVQGQPVLRIPNVIGGYIDITDLKYGQPKPNELESLKLLRGDLLFVRTNGTKENSGRCSMYRDELGSDCYFASYLIRVCLEQDQLEPAFLDEYTRTETGTSFLSGQAIRTADGKFNINSGTLQRMLVPKPTIDEQIEIVKILSNIDAKVNVFLLKKEKLQDLFQTLLHHLMTAQIRVDDLDLSALNLELQGGKQDALV